MWRFGDFLDKEKVTRRRLDTASNRCCFPWRANGKKQIKHLNTPQNLPQEYM